MSKMSDRKYLLANQYHDSSNLDARVQLHRRFSTNKYDWFLWAFEQLDIPPQSRILELGCGPGGLWLENSHRIPDGWEIVLSDLSRGMLQDAQWDLGANQQRFHFVVVDAQSIPFQDESFDAVIANHVLYHVPDRMAAFSEIHRLLRPSGRFFAATNGRTHLQELRELMERFDPNIVFGTRDYSFGLENGSAQLSKWFRKVQLRRYKDSLAVTEVDPLVAYIMSSIGNAEAVFTGDKLAALVTSIEREITSQGAIHIIKDVGIFEAIRDEAV